jgi:MFS family permease
MDTAPLRSRPIRALLAAEVVSISGAQMTWVALPWFVLTTTGSATRMSLVMAAELIGLALAGFPSGGVIRRLGARRTMVLCDAVRGPVMLLIPVLHWQDALSFAPLVIVAFVLGALSAPHFAASRLILPELLGEDERTMSQASALFQGATRITLLLGPVAAGVLIGVIGAPAVLVVDAATYVVAVVLVVAFVPATKPIVEDEAEDRGVVAGLRWVAREPLIRAWRVCFIVGDAAWQAIFVALPVLVVARYHADPKIVGALFAAFGVGAVLGNVVAYRLVRNVDGLRLIATVALGQALPLWLLVFELPAAGAVGALFASGVANGLINPSLHAIMTLRIPPPLRPSVLTSLMTFHSLAMPIGLLGAGPLLDAYGVGPVFMGTAAIQTAAMSGLALAANRARAPAPPVGLPSRTAPRTRRAESRWRRRRRESM